MSHFRKCNGELTTTLVQHIISSSVFIKSWVFLVMYYRLNIVITMEYTGWYTYNTCVCMMSYFVMWCHNACGYSRLYVYVCKPVHRRWGWLVPRSYVECPEWQVSVGATFYHTWAKGSQLALTVMWECSTTPCRTGVMYLPCSGLYWSEWVILLFWVLATHLVTLL